MVRVVVVLWVPFRQARRKSCGVRGCGGDDDDGIFEGMIVFGNSLWIGGGGADFLGVLFPPFRSYVN